VRGTHAFAPHNNKKTPKPASLRARGFAQPSRFARSPDKTSTQSEKEMWALVWGSARARSDVTYSGGADGSTACTKVTNSTEGVAAVGERGRENTRARADHGAAPAGKSEAAGGGDGHSCGRKLHNPITTPGAQRRPQFGAPRRAAHHLTRLRCCPRPLLGTGAGSHRETPRGSEAGSRAGPEGDTTPHRKIQVR
jgi:hypothetical protein